jgi:hypothetical protein
VEEAVLFKKKNQKTFILQVAQQARSLRITGSKSFLVLFLKKELLSSCCLSRQGGSNGWREAACGNTV